MPKNDFLKDIFIIDAVRTAIGGTFKALKNFSPAQLAAFTIKEILERNRMIKKDLVNQVILGNTVSAGTGQNLARGAAFLSGLPHSIPSFTVNNVCGSGLQSMILGAHMMRCNEADVVVVGGAESSSQSPYLVKKSQEDKKDNLIDSLIFDGLMCQLTDKHMGQLAEHIAEKFRISRLEQDRYAFESHKKACRAQEKGRFTDEIVGVVTTDGQVFKEDQRPRKNIDLEKLGNLPPAFKKDGTVTAGNSSLPSDGAAVLLLASQAVLETHKLKPIARLLGYASIMIEPKEVFTAAIPAVRECLQKSRLSLKDIDLFEISEAFAVSAIVTQKELGIPEDKMNIFGGDVALGHPLGAAGARILVTLLHALRQEGKKKGVTAVCLGGGGAVAMAVEITNP